MKVHSNLRFRSETALVGHEQFDRCGAGKDRLGPVQSSQSKPLASRKGFEPLTPGLGNLCSILLSYRDVALLMIALYPIARARQLALSPGAG